jgi:ectoine hydroxylase-related dioxygenase (phytanoyl-CoA dioxygenase family)|tara:strand:+ start:6995 stop:7711 length:717 start_codon:yes stop_codon:yes gene_type:complete
VRLTEQQINQYNTFGFIVVRGLFEPLAGSMIAHYMKMRAEGSKPGDTGGTMDVPNDPNHEFPRMINMHDWDQSTQYWSTASELIHIAGELIDDKPVLCQTMLYFKPPGGRGQALHQDQQYITTDPLIGVWVALDKSDQSVGQMIVIPKSHQYGLLEVEPADTSISFTNVQSVIPQDAEQVGLDMEPGDVLFFDGKMIHGSYRNSTTDRWRRSFICHYIGENSQSFVAPQGKHVSHLKV